VWSDIWSETAGDYPVCRPPTAGRSYRGTADAVFQNLELLDIESDFVLVLSGDHIYQMDYRDLLRQHIATNADLTIATVEHPLAEASAFGVVQVNEELKVTGFKEKPANPYPSPSNPSMAMVSMGVYVFKKKVLLAALSEICESGRGFDFGHDVIPYLIHSGRTYAYDFRDKISNAPNYWRDIGTIDAYYAASMDLARRDAQLDVYANHRWSTNPTLHRSFPYGVSRTNTPGWLHGNARIERSVLGPGVRVERNAVVEESVLMHGVHVGKGAELRHAVVDEGVKIPDGFKVRLHSGQAPLHCAVTESGILVISSTRSSSNPAVLRFPTEAVLKTRIDQARGIERR